MDIKDIKKELEKEQDEGRFEHTLGVMYTCAALAMRYDYDMDKAILAGLLHDCAKCIPNPKKLKLAEKHGLDITPFEAANPFMLHAKLGVVFAREKYGVKDEEILSSIRWHTTGKPDMSLLDKIVYIADYIEPKRDKAPNLKLIRQLAFTDLDKCLIKILEDTLGYLDSSVNDIDEMTKLTYDYYVSIANN